MKTKKRNRGKVEKSSIKKAHRKKRKIYISITKLYLKNENK